MIIHQAIRYFIHKYGTDILLRKRVYNLMRDCHFFKYEDSTMQSTLEIILEKYGEKLYKGINSDEWNNVYSRCRMDCTRRYSFNKEITEYIFESIAYGCGKISQISKNHLVPLSDSHFKRECYSVFYNLCGFNLMPIKGDTNDWYANTKSFKNPAHGEWTDFKSADLDLSIITDISSNSNYTGIAGLLGHNELRVLDFDDLGLFSRVINAPWFNDYPEFDIFLKFCLNILGLPEDYQWVVRSGGGVGFHIIFKTDEVPNFNPEIISFQSSKSFRKAKTDVKALDLIWNGYVALPPTLGARFFDTNCFEVYPYIYRFYNRKIFPDYEPIKIPLGNLNNFLNTYCAEDSFYGGWIKGMTLYGNKKRSSEWGSYSNDYLSYNDSIEWLECCANPEASNMAAIKHIERGEFDIASNLLSKNQTFPFSAYNYAVLISLGHVPFSSTLLSTLTDVFEFDSRISQYDKKKLNNQLQLLKTK